MTIQGRAVVLLSCFHPGSLGMGRLCCQSWEEGEGLQNLQGQPRCHVEMSFVHCQYVCGPAVNLPLVSFL